MIMKFIILLTALLALGLSLLYSLNIDISTINNRHTEPLLSNNQQSIKFITNNDGDIKLSYIELGDLNSYQHTIIQFHPTPGSLSSQLHSNEDQLAKKYNLRLIKFDRPGIGQSSIQLNSTVCACSKPQYDLIMKSIQLLTSKLNITSYSIIGHQLGAFYALLHTINQSKTNNNNIDSIVLFSPLIPTRHSMEHQLISSLYNKILGKRTSAKLFRSLWLILTNRLLPIEWTIKLLNLINNSNVNSNVNNSNQYESIYNSLNQNTMTLFEEFNYYYFNSDDNSVNNNIEALLSSSNNVKVMNDGDDYEQALQFIHNKFVTKKQNQPNMNPTTTSTTTTSTTNTPSTPTDATPSKPSQSTTEQQQSSSKASSSSTTTTTTTDQTNTNKPKVVVAVIGGGLAGLSAAIELAELGGQSIKVYLLEKEDRTGGNSAKATSGINGVLTNAQRSLHINDTIPLFISDTEQSGKFKGCKQLIETLVRESTSAIQFLEDHQIGMELVTQCGGHSQPRTHRSAPPTDKQQRVMNVGSEITFKLLKYIENNLKDRVIVMTNTKMIGFIKNSNNGDIIGIKYIKNNEQQNDEVKELLVTSVILTTGGYAADRNGYLNEYAPHLSHLPTTNGKFANGEGIRMAVNELNASLIHMDSIQVHPTGFIDPLNPQSMTVFLAAEALRAYGGIIVNQEGQRFCNELGRRDYVSDQIFKYCKHEEEKGHTIAYMIMNDYVAKSFSESLLSFYMNKGFIKKYNNMEHLLNSENDQSSFKYLNLEQLIKTIEKYNEIGSSSAGSSDSNKAVVTDEFGKNIFPTLFNLNSTLYLSKITPAIHYTHGGLLFDNRARVLKRVEVVGDDNKEVVVPIKNLYTAGEASGGLHGLNRLAGNSLLECVVYGRIAAREIINDHRNSGGDSDDTQQQQQQQSKL